MAKKKAPTKKPTPPTAERAQLAARVGNFPVALDIVRQLRSISPTPEHLALHKQILAAAATHYANHNEYGQFNRVILEAEAIDPQDMAWTAERAVLLVRGGRLGDALALADQTGDPAVRARVEGQGVDRAFSHHTESTLPEALRPGCNAIVTAFGHYEAGNDTAVREALEPIGLRSPYLEWKVLLRGLMAYANGDDLRAAENFGRLDATRLPARLAAPFRQFVDPAYKASLPAGTASLLASQYEKLMRGAVGTALRTIARDLGRGRSLEPVFRSIEAAMPVLKAQAPQLIPRLANVLYHALIHQGEPRDLPRYQKTFGSPPNDPKFNKLLAQVTEQLDDSATSHHNWRMYDAWLATNPRGWPPAVLNRARAVVWLRMGKCAQQFLENQDEDDLGLFSIRRRRTKPKPLDPPAEECYRQAVQLAPDWADPARDLIEILIAASRFADAEAVTRAYLSHKPNDIEVMAILATLVMQQKRASEAAEIWLRTLAINPFDHITRHRVASAILAAARQLLVAGAAADVDPLLDQHITLLQEQTPAGLAGLRSVVRVKLGQPAEAAEYRTQAITWPGARLSAAYRIMVDSLLAKLKPADKRAADKLFADEAAKPPTPVEVTMLLRVGKIYHNEGITYRGQKTHDKKILDLVPKCFTATAPEEDFEQLGGALLQDEQWKLLDQFTRTCCRRFPQNPTFLLLRIEFMLAKQVQFYTLPNLLQQAKRLADLSTQPRHKDLAQRIDDLLKHYGSPFTILSNLFGDED